MEKRIYKRFITVFFYIGVNIVGIPDLFRLELKDFRKELNIKQRYSYN
jgi:hypothetical protein